MVCGRIRLLYYYTENNIEPKDEITQYKFNKNLSTKYYTMHSLSPQTTLDLTLQFRILFLTILVSLGLGPLTSTLGTQGRVLTSAPGMVRFSSKLTLYGSAH